jgi:tol-pal system protein YbgF
MLVGLEQLSDQIEQLQANLGDTNYRLAQLSQQITATNQELQAVRSSLGGALRGPSTTVRSQPPPENPRDLYQSAYNDYLSGNYDLAILGFRRYLEAFPETDLADNAAYWIAESNFSQRKYSQAIKEFDDILQAYPRSDKTPSIMLKKGYSYLEMGQREQGLVQLRSVIRQFPETDEANLARQRLVSLGVDGG